jgi:hypothetical protein
MASGLSRKLKIRENNVLLLVGAPPDFKPTLDPLPNGVKISSKVKNFDQLHWFVRDKKQMETELPGVLKNISDKVICWIYFPKGTSKIQTDLTRDKGWEALLSKKGLKWLSLISFDETWSAFAMRREQNSHKKVVHAPREIFNWVDPVKKLVKFPDDLEKAFSKNKKALEFFQALSFTNKKEYVEWIVTAKRDETRIKRVAETIDRLIKGWKNPRNL